MANKKFITGPTFEEMLHPEKIHPDIRAKALRMKQEDPLDPINLFNITWKNQDNQIYHYVLPKELTGVEAPIVVMYGVDFPTGSHKVGAAYSVLIEKELFGEVDPGQHTLVWPSTGNYGIGGAFVGCRMNFDSVVVLPANMSRERFERIEGYGAQIIRTPGSESNVKEIYDKTWELRRDPNVRVLNQFEVMGNYRFHYHVTGNTVAELADVLQKQGVGNGRIAAYVSAMGSGGTIAAGDRLKQLYPDHKIVGLEPVQCPTLFNNGYGAHRIEGIGDKHVTWVHNVLNMDAVICVDDMSCVRGLALLNDEVAHETLTKRYSVPAADLKAISRLFGISGVCNVLGAIKTAKYYNYGPDDVIVTICTDAIDRYYSVMDWLREEEGQMDEALAAARMESTFRGQKTDWVQEGTQEARQRWHNLKYYTWVEQQGKTVEELDAQRDPAWWQEHQALVSDIDKRLIEARETEYVLPAS
jgi:cysteine synthase